MGTDANPATPTTRQAEALDFIRQFWATNSKSPTFMEIADALKIGQPTVWEHVQGLIRKGHVKYTPRHSRSLVVQDRCPCCGRPMQDEEGGADAR